MDTEVLISEVGKREILWDRTNRLHHNRIMLDKSWTEVSLVLDCSAKEARTKWKNLKDHFRKEFKKEQSRQETNETLEDTSEVTWCHFKSLMFLQDQMVCSSRQSTKQPQDANTVKTELADRNDDILFETSARDDDIMDSDSNFYKVDKSDVFVVDAPELDPLPADPTPDEELLDTNSLTPVKPSAGEGANEFRPKMKSKNRNTKIVSPRGPPKKRQKKFGGNYDVMSDYGKTAGIDKKTGKPNENYHFVMTLLPHLDRLTPAKRLTVQIKIQQAVFSAIYGNDRSSSDSTPSYDSASSY